MVRTLPLGLDEALALTLDNIQPLGTQHVGLLDGLMRGVAEALCAKVDSPSIDASMKDGFAVISAEVAGASKVSPVVLTLAGSMTAGGKADVRVDPGTTVRVLTGAKIPPGADAVVAEEFVSVEKDAVTIYNDAEPGRNILPRGSDVAAGEVVVAKGSALTPGKAGLLAAAGYHEIPVVRNPSVAIIATGDEVVAPGQPLSEGQLYASNMTTLAGWCRRYGLKTHLQVVRDDADEIFEALKRFNTTADAIVTSGGAWTGDRDLVAAILDRLGWRQIFHRIRIGPGKAVGFGLLHAKPVFILPGGPPSNLMGFLQIALPGLLKLAGYRHTGLPTVQVTSDRDLTGRHADWTQFLYGTIEMRSPMPVFHLLRSRSRLQSMAEAQAVVAIPEGKTILPAGSVIAAQLLE
jgi:molybdopterin molybdotransferase